LEALKGVGRENVGFFHEIQFEIDLRLVEVA
jgi:hypothetical protein